LFKTIVVVSQQEKEYLIESLLKRLIQMKLTNPNQSKTFSNKKKLRQIRKMIFMKKFLKRFKKLLVMPN